MVILLACSSTPEKYVITYPGKTQNLDQLIQNGVMSHKGVALARQRVGQVLLSAQ